MLMYCLGGRKSLPWVCVRQDTVSGLGDSLEASARLTLYAVTALSRLNSHNRIVVASEYV